MANDGRLSRLAKVYGLGERSAFVWDNWAALDAAIREFLLSGGWPDAAAVYAGIVAEKGMDRKHQVSDREWQDLCVACSCYGALKPFDEAREALADALLDIAPNLAMALDRVAFFRIAARDGALGGQGAS